MSSTDIIRAAGGVVRRLDPDGTPRVLLIHRDRYDDWTFPKGKCEPGESEKRAAVREVTEETGIVARREFDLGRVEYEIDGHPKTIRFWLMGYRSDLGVTDGEVDAMQWCTLDEARALLTYPHDRSLLDAIDATTRPGHIWLVRHAKAGSRSTYDGDDHTRPLTDIGIRQADAIAELLRDKPISRIVSSPFTRCVQTVEPLASALEISVTADATLGEGNDDHAVWRWCAQPEPVVLCSHGDVLGATMDALADAGIVSNTDAGMPAKGSVWRLTTRGGTVVAARALRAIVSA